MIVRQIFFLSFFIFPFFVFSQEKEDTEKMFREIINVEVDRATYAPKPVAVEQPVDPKSKKKKKYVEPVEPEPDTLPPMMPAPATVVLKRAQNWYTAKTTKYEKTNGSNTGKSVKCSATFIYKQKLLNPENDVDGKIVMDIVIEAKEGKYRYTIQNIKHKANRQHMSGGDVYAQVPEAGSMNITDRTWKHIRSEAFANAKKVIDDIKEIMQEEVVENKEEW